MIVPGSSDGFAAGLQDVSAPVGLAAESCASVE
jgi:hypothetical protein